MSYTTLIREVYPLWVPRRAPPPTPPESLALLLMTSVDSLDSWKRGQKTISPDFVFWPHLFGDPRKLEKHGPGAPFAAHRTERPLFGPFFRSMFWPPPCPLPTRQGRPRPSKAAEQTRKEPILDLAGSPDGVLDYSGGAANPSKSLAG